ncbi:FCD domain protein [Caballeronia catudaia]|uniref:FCD domain protein n=1 Tax=Caballeronia catudaia TaxID=1777136 RepID=A0A158DFK4_9BURK|nr:FCD domain-containing protein [Caballeronia catudaia]SAK93243.1 FCD domain protein [Caballeronia catudaia]
MTTVIAANGWTKLVLVRQDYELRTLLEPAAVRASAPTLPREKLEAALRDIERAIDDPGSIHAAALHHLETTLHDTFLAGASNRKLLATISHAHMPLIVNHAFYDAFRLHPEMGTLTEHRTVIELLLQGKFDAASEALAAAASSRTRPKLERFAAS